jgi:hypothetical protein
MYVLNYSGAMGRWNKRTHSSRTRTNVFHIYTTSHNTSSLEALFYQLLMNYIYDLCVVRKETTSSPLYLEKHMGQLVVALAQVWTTSYGDERQQENPTMAAGAV